MAEHTFDNRRIDMMMERYRQEIIRMQRARATKVEEPKEIKEESASRTYAAENEILPKEEKNEEIKEEAKEEIREEIGEQTNSEIKEELNEKVHEEINEELSEEINEEINQHLIEEAEDIKDESSEDVNFKDTEKPGDEKEICSNEETVQEAFESTADEEEESKGFEGENIEKNISGDEIFKEQEEIEKIEYFEDEPIKEQQRSKEEENICQKEPDVGCYEDANLVFKEQILDAEEEKEPDSSSESTEEKNEDGFKREKNIFSRLYKKRNRERLFFSDSACAGGKFYAYGTLPAFLSELSEKEAQAHFSSFDSTLPDLQRGPKLLEIKLKGERDFCLFFCSFPCFFADDLDDVKDFLLLREKNNDRGMLWEYLIDHKDALDYVLYNFSDMGTPSSYCASYYSPAFMAQENGSICAFKLALKPKQKEKSFSSFAAMEKGSIDRDYLKRDLAGQLEEGRTMEFEVLLLKIKELSLCRFNPFLPTTAWENEERIPIGKITFEKKGNGEEYFSMDMLPVGVFLSKEHFYSLVKSVNWAHKDNLDMYIDFNDRAFLKSPRGDFKKSGFDMASERIKNMTDRELRRLKENIAESMENLSGDTLERALVILSDADLDFGKSLMDMIEA